MSTPRYENFANGLGILPKGASTNASMGDIEVLSTGGLLNYHNGTTSSAVVTVDHTAVLTNKTLTGNTAVNLISGAGTFTFNTTGTITAPNTTDTLVTLDLSQILTNKTLTGNTAANLISGAGTLILNTSGTVTIPNGTDTLVGLTTTQTLTNKSFDDTTTAIVDTVDPTKKIKFDAAGTTGTSTTLLSSQTTDKTLTLPDATDTVVVLALGQTLTNKTLTAPTINVINGLAATTFSITADVNQNISLVTSGTGLTTIGNITFYPATTTIDGGLLELTVQGGTGFGANLNLTTVASGSVLLQSGGSTVTTVNSSGLTMATAKPLILTRNSQTVSLQANSAASASYTIAFPAAAPTANTTLLTTDGTTFTWGVPGDTTTTYIANAGETITAGQALYLNSSGVCFKLDATNDSKIEFAGIATTSNTVGLPVTIKSGGIITLDTSSFTAGLPVYASVTTPGSFQSTAPTTGGQWSIQLGSVLTSSVTGTMAVNSALSATAIKISGDSDTPAYNTYGSPSSVTASGITSFPVVSTANVRTIFVKGSGVGVVTTVTATTPIPIESQPGIILNIVGTSDADQLLFQDTTDLKLIGNCTLVQNSVLTLISTGSLWIEQTRNN